MLIISNSTRIFKIWNIDKEKLTGKLITLPLDIMHSIVDEKSFPVFIIMLIYLLTKVLR